MKFGENYHDIKRLLTTKNKFKMMCIHDYSHSHHYILLFYSMSLYQMPSPCCVRGISKLKGLPGCGKIVKDLTFSSYDTPQRLNKII